jgi:hypothetical protein
MRNRKARAQETAETRTNRRISNREKMQQKQSTRNTMQKQVLTAAFQIGKKCNKTEHKKLQKHVLTAAF